MHMLRAHVPGSTRQHHKTLYTLGLTRTAAQVLTQEGASSWANSFAWAGLLWLSWALAGNRQNGRLDEHFCETQKGFRSCGLHILAGIALTAGVAFLSPLV